MLLSIIVPIYMVNKNLLNKCINSILNQSFSDFELILINDGSPNLNKERFFEYQNIDNRIKVIYKDNGGVSSARNLGIKLSKGKYIGFVDADDWIEKDFYYDMVNFAENSNLDIICSGYVKDIDGKIIRILDKKNKKILNSNEAMMEMIKREIYTWSIWDKIYRKDMFNNSLFDESIKMGEDLELLWKIFKKAKVIGYLPLYKYHYCFRKDSVTNNNDPIKKFDSIKVMKKIKLETKKINLQNRIKELYIKELASCNKMMILFNEYKYKKYIIEFQKEIRKNIFCLINNRDFSFKVKLGIIYFLMPYKVCAKFKKYIIHY